MQIAGVLILAAGVPRALRRPRLRASSRSATWSCGSALVAQWLRAARGDPAAPAHVRSGYARRHQRVHGRLVRAARRCPTGGRGAGFFVHGRRRAAACRSGPSGAGPTSWHPRHIAERYGLFTLIVLGESVLAATLAVQCGARRRRRRRATSLVIVGGGLLIVFAMWWIYFAKPAEQ